MMLRLYKISVNKYLKVIAQLLINLNKKLFPCRWNLKKWNNKWSNIKNS